MQNNPKIKEVSSTKKLQSCSVSDKFISQVIKKKTCIHVFLTSGIKLQGTICEFDPTCFHPTKGKPTLYFRGEK